MPSGRPVTVDLTGQKFGILKVAQRGHGRNWLCICECGRQATYRTEELRWHGKKDCGCGMGKHNPRASVYRSYYVPRPIVGYMPKDLLIKFGPPQDRRCSICGHLGARSILPAYGIYEPRFREQHEDTRVYMTLCSICFGMANKNRIRTASSITPSLWMLFLEDLKASRYPVVPENRYGLAELVLEKQTTEEQVSPAGAKARALAEEVMRSRYAGQP